MSTSLVRPRYAPAQIINESTEVEAIREEDGSWRLWAGHRSLGQVAGLDGPPPAANWFGAGHYWESTADPDVLALMRTYKLIEWLEEA